MNRFLSFALLLGLAMCASADDRRQSMEARANQGDKKPNMFPMSKGAQWEFDLNVNGMTVPVVQEMTEVTKKGDKIHATLTTKASGQNIDEEMSVDDKGVHRHSFNNIKLETPILAIKYPVQPQKWTENIKLAGMEIEVKMEMKAAEDVTVPAGKYKNVTPVAINMTIQGQEITATNYYAEGVGIIKQEANFAGTKISSELKKFTPGDK
ncbi:MAG: hypothetical protein QM703_11555 [Gemmatales bacterium]